MQKWEVQPNQKRMEEEKRASETRKNEGENERAWARKLNERSNEQQSHTDTNARLTICIVHTCQTPCHNQINQIKSYT